MLKTLKQKLLALVVLAIGGTLLLSGVALSVLIQRDHEDSNREALQGVFERTARELRGLRAKAEYSRDELLSRTGLRDSLYLVVAYADPDTYQSIIFDEEKKKLSRMLLNHARSSGDFRILLYDDTGTLVAFSQQKDEQVLQGITSIRDGRRVILLNRSNVDEHDQWEEITGEEDLGLPAIHEQLPEDGVWFHAIQSHIGALAAARIQQRFPDGSSLHIGTIMVGRAVGREFLDDVTSRFNGYYSLFTKDGLEIGDHLNIGRLIQGQAVPELFAGEATGTPWQHPDNAFLQAFRVGLADGDSFYVAASVDSTLAQTQGQQVVRVALVAFLVAVLFLFPVVVWFSRRAIISPIEQLERSARALGDGQYSITISPSGSAEVDKLSHTLRETARTIHEREEELRSSSDILQKKVEERTADLSEANDSLLRSQRMLQLVMDNIPQYVFWKDANLDYLGCNANFLKVTGKSSVDEIIGCTDYDLPWSREEADFYRKVDREVMDSDQPRYQIHETSHTASGEEIHLETNKVPLHDADGRVIGILGTFEDITERVLNEQQLREAKEIAEQASRAKSQFLSRMSHELRTPLNAILGFSQLILLQDKDKAGEGQREYVAEILTAGEHLLRLISEVLDLSRIESGGLSLNHEVVHLNQVIAEAVKLVRNAAEHHHIDLAHDLGGDAEHMVLADTLRVRQVLVNLLSNAIKYNRPDGSVELSCRVIDDHRLRVDVSDTGPGISAEDQARLFRPFERLGAELSGVDGTGIGLVIVKEMVERMGGEIGVESSVGKGSTFWFTLPLADAAGATMPSNEPVDQDTVTPPMAKLPSTAAHKILYVEDNHANFRLIEQLLKTKPAIELLWAESGPEGLEMATRFKPSAILMDMRMPGMSGDETFLKLQEREDTRDIPVVALSANALPDDIESALALGFRSYLTKPVNLQVLLETLRNILSLDEL